MKTPTTADHPKYHVAIAHTQPGRDSFSRIRAVPLISEQLTVGRDRLLCCHQPRTELVSGHITAGTSEKLTPIRMVPTPVRSREAQQIAEHGALRDKMSAEYEPAPQEPYIGAIQIHIAMLYLEV
jgi:hypothetical protein